MNLTVATPAQMIDSVCFAAVALGIAASPLVSEELVAAARAFVEADAVFARAKASDGYAPLKIGLARETAFFEFQTAYELEFPNG